ncbi:uncharacterized protein LOC117643000 [Thrips palmi]|uniref:Gustatory receptor n=1 Tax=Thrips palmi TaxID=161013 RepID=A0A6P8YCY1_THRPL|nr:uncharacterized protein LOC117643000 [Thrips palmi]
MGASPPRWGPGQGSWGRDSWERRGNNKVWNQRPRRWDGAPLPPDTDPGRREAGRGGAGGIPFLLVPGYCVSRLLGLLPLRYVPRENPAADKDTWLKVSLPWLPFCLAMAVCSAYATYYQTDEFRKVVIKTSTDLSNYVYEVPMLLNTVIALLCTWYSLVSARSMAVSWRTAHTTLAELDALNRSPPSTSRHCRPLESWAFFLLVWFNMGMGVVAHLMYTYTKETKMEWYVTAAIMAVRLVPLAIESQYLLSCLLLQRAYRSITICFRNMSRGFFPSDQPESLMDGPLDGRKVAWGAGQGQKDHQKDHQKTGPPGPSRHALLSRLRVLHQRVFQQVEDLTEYFGPQLLCKLVQTRIQLITDAFALVGAVQSQVPGDAVKLPFWAIEVCFLAYRLFVVVYRSEKVLQQDQVLMQLVCLVDPSSWDHASTQQLQLFRRQVRALRAELHTCSMFTLNYDLLLAVAATTTTYLVVLVQFQPKSSAPPT